MQNSKSAPQTAASSTPYKDKTVLLVEDDFTHRAFMEKILSDIEAAFIDVESHFRKEGYI